MRRTASFSPLVCLLLAGIAACGGSGDDDDGAAGDEATADAPRATPPPPTAAAGTAPPVATTTDLLNLLPKAADIGPLQLGIPAVAAIRSMAAEVKQDPTGPCGAALEALTLEGAAGRTYETVNGRIVGIIVPRDAAVDAYVEANRADLTAGCPSHTTTAADGTEITLSTPEAVDVSATVPEGVAWISNVEQPADGGAHATVLLPVGDNALLVTMSSTQPLDAAFVQTMAEVWSAKATAAA
jgi:hypothetical protein